MVGAGAKVAAGSAGKVTHAAVRTGRRGRVPVHTNGSTVRIGGDDDDDVDVPPFMRR